MMMENSKAQTQSLKPSLICSLEQYHLQHWALDHSSKLGCLCFTIWLKKTFQRPFFGIPIYVLIYYAMCFYFIFFLIYLCLHRPKKLGLHISKIWQIHKFFITELISSSINLLFLKSLLPSILKFFQPIIGFCFFFDDDRWVCVF